MGNLISFMKEVADGLRESGNFGTAHIYRSSLSAILAFHGAVDMSATMPLLYVWILKHLGALFGK